MIKAILIFNTKGTARLTKFYKRVPDCEQQYIIKSAFEQITERGIDSPYFFDASALMGPDTKFVYRNYATLYFVFCVDEAENALMVLDLIKVFVETLDQYFENVRELDIVFHFEKVHEILNEFIQGGFVMELNQEKIVAHVHEQDRIQRQEVSKSTNFKQTLFRNPSRLPQTERFRPSRT
ncbi:hypothetical protein L596_018306 [Steinernema carpocapsae]|uniref:AP complex subunit sigma n=1 Tax=Steinernema carpocapsae TaxID=34508 RepID=A0A4U5N4B1_STECR|nr:hypothetical protein L596_018306 [Steinernema carpocapsae]